MDSFGDTAISNQSKSSLDIVLKSCDGVHTVETIRNSICDLDSNEVPNDEINEVLLRRESDSTKVCLWEEGGEGSDEENKKKDVFHWEGR